MTELPKDYYGYGHKPFDELLDRPSPLDLLAVNEPVVPPVIDLSPLPDGLDALDVALLGVESAAALSGKGLKSEAKTVRSITTVDTVEALKAYIKAGASGDTDTLKQAGTILRAAGAKERVAYDPLTLLVLEQETPPSEQ